MSAIEIKTSISLKPSTGILYCGVLLTKASRPELKRGDGAFLGPPNDDHNLIPSKKPPLVAAIQERFRISDDQMKNIAVLPKMNGPIFETNPLAGGSRINFD